MYNSNVKINKAIILITAALVFFVQPIFEKSSIANERHFPSAKEVESMSVKLKTLTNKDHHEVKRLAYNIQKEGIRHNISPDLILAILKVESSFDQNAISPTGDVSMAQINTEIWNKEFRRLKRPLIDSKKIKKDPDYAIKVMVEILSIIKNQRKNDPEWYSVYHSKTPSFRLAYTKKLKKELSLISSL